MPGCGAQVRRAAQAALSSLHAALPPGAQQQLLWLLVCLLPGALHAGAASRHLMRLVEALATSAATAGPGAAQPAAPCCPATCNPTLHCHHPRQTVVLTVLTVRAGAELDAAGMAAAASSAARAGPPSHATLASHHLPSAQQQQQHRPARAHAGGAPAAGHQPRSGSSAAASAPRHARPAGPASRAGGHAAAAGPSSRQVAEAAAAAATPRPPLGFLCGSAAALLAGAHAARTAHPLRGVHQELCDLMDVASWHLEVSTHGST